MSQPKTFHMGTTPDYAPYHEVGSTYVPLRRPSKWNPLHWPKWTWLAAFLLLLALAIGLGVGITEGTKNKKYPNYFPLNYTIADNYTGTTFFDNFDYFTGYDPSSGFVHYVPAETANSLQYNLTYASSTSAVLRVDTTDTEASTGRYSVRITSKKQYTTGLFVFDILHSPYGCSTWPALWLSDPSNWPTNGEIDVVEAVNQATTGNQMTLHTSAGCTMKNVARRETRKVLTTNCLNSTDDNAGCGVRGPADTYGAALNANGGGVYAIELRAAGIRVWFFGRDNIPSDLIYGNDSTPDPSRWGEALADFPGTDCDIGTHFRNQSIIADIDLCGSWAGERSVYEKQDDCPGPCESFVAGNNTAFETAYWDWAGFRVYAAS